MHNTVAKNYGKGANYEKTKRILMTVTLLIAAVFLLNAANLPAANVQAASKGTYRAILQAYKRNDYRKVQRLSKTLPKNAMKSAPEN